MKNTKSLLMIVVSLLFGLVAVVVAGKWVTDQARMDSTAVLVASRDIDVGTRLSEDMLMPTEWPSASKPIGSFQDPVMLAGRVLKSHLVQGEPVLESKLAPEGTSGGLSGVIAEGKRAITVRVNDVIGVAGFALPGNKVDILVNAEDEKRKPFARIVLEQILVLAVAQDVGRDDTKPKVVTAVTLEVSPQEAETLDLARSIGSLSLVLRNQMDNQHVDTEGRRISDLLNEIPLVVAAPTKQKQKTVYRRRKPKSPTIAVIRGTNQSQVSMSKRGGK
jgi:pilus assembly protein CpaB